VHPVRSSPASSARMAAVALAAQPSHGLPAADSHLFAWEAERAARGRVAAFPRSFPRRKAPEEAR
jgi:hypothetical protein